MNPATPKPSTSLSRQVCLLREAVKAAVWLGPQMVTFTHRTVPDPVSIWLLQWSLMEEPWDLP